jgi:hypothetical protein
MLGGGVEQNESWWPIRLKSAICKVLLKLFSFNFIIPDHFFPLSFTSTSPRAALLLLQTPRELYLKLVD